MKKYIVFIIVLGILSCSKYKTQFTGKYDPNISDSTFTMDVPEFLYINNSKVFLTDLNFKKTKQISQNNEVVTSAVINTSHDKIAYKEQNKNIRIIDIKRNVDSIILNTEDVVCFDWREYENVFYTLNDNGIFNIYGSTINGFNQIDLTTISGQLQGIKKYTCVDLVGYDEFVFTYFNSSTNQMHLFLQGGDFFTNNLTLNNVYSCYNLKTSMTLNNNYFFTGTIAFRDTLTHSNSFFEIYAKSDKTLSVIKKSGIKVTRWSGKTEFSWSDITHQLYIKPLNRSIYSTQNLGSNANVNCLDSY